MTATKTKAESLAEVSGLTVAEVQEKLDAGFLFYKEPDYFGGEVPPGEWLDANGTEVVVLGSGGGFGGHWGKGPDLAEAKRNFRRYGGVLSHGYAVLTFGPGSVFLGVGGLGYRYLGDPPTMTEVPARGKR